jgi:hypothetical protein
MTHGRKRGISPAAVKNSAPTDRALKIGSHGAGICVLRPLAREMGKQSTELLSW